MVDGDLGVALAASLSAPLLLKVAWHTQKESLFLCLWLRPCVRCSISHTHPISACVFRRHVYPSVTYSYTFFRGRFRTRGS